jgi:hypothetical protein
MHRPAPPPPRRRPARCQGTPLGLACCSEEKFGERGGVCIPEDTLEQLEKMMGPGS